MRALRATAKPERSSIDEAVRIATFAVSIYLLNELVIWDQRYGKEREKGTGCVGDKPEEGRE